MIRFGEGYAELAGIQYMGCAGMSASCLHAIRRLFVAGDNVERAILVSADQHHAFLLNIGQADYPEWVAIKAGFSSGYSGEGPRSLSEAIALLFEFHVYVTEIEVKGDLLARLDQSALTARDLTTIIESPRVKADKVALYLYDAHLSPAHPGRSLQQLPAPIPWGVLDYRLRDLANKFNEDPDYALIAGFRRLEDIVRKRIGTDASESKVFSQAFLGESPKLSWPGIPVSERIARGNLFIGAYGAFRNPRAHREQLNDRDVLISEFQTLNHLYRLEAAAEPFQN